MSVNENVVEQWLGDFVRNETKLTEIATGKPLFQQMDSFEIVSFLLAAEEGFLLGEGYSGDSMATMTFADVVTFIATHARQ